MIRIRPDKLYDQTADGPIPGHVASPASNSLKSLFQEKASNMPHRLHLWSLVFLVTVGHTPVTAGVPDELIQSHGKLIFEDRFERPEADDSKSNWVTDGSRTVNVVLRAFNREISKAECWLSRWQRSLTTASRSNTMLPSTTKSSESGSHTEKRMSKWTQNETKGAGWRKPVSDPDHSPSAFRIAATA